MLKYYASLLFALGLSHAFGSDQHVTISGLQLPAWIERDGTTQAAYVGMQLQTSDVLKLGAQGKALLDLPEGSVVKLGNNSVFELTEFYQENADQTLFTGALNMLAGVFRFTTTNRSAALQRNIDIRTTTSTVGIRGTDLWGQSDPERDFVVLIEGKIEVAKIGQAPVFMTTPLSIYDMPKSSPAQLGSIDMPTLLQFAPLTELDHGQGVLKSQGQYAVVLQSTLGEASAISLTQQFNQLGYPADVVQASLDQQTWHRVIINRFASLADAVSFAESINGTLAVAGAWVIKL